MHASILPQFKIANVINIAKRTIGSISFRNATQSDIPIIYHFTQKLLEVHGTEDAIFPREDLYSIMAVNNKRSWLKIIISEYTETGQTGIAGMQSYFRTYSPYCIPSVYLNGFYIDAKYRKAGITSEFYKRFFKILADEGVELCFGSQYLANTASRNLAKKNGFFDITTQEGVHEMGVHLKHHTFAGYNVSPNISVRDVKVEDFAAIGDLLQDSRNHKIAPRLITKSANELATDGLSNEYFETIVATDNTKFDQFGNNIIVGFALYTKAFPLFLGRIIHLASICVKPEYGELNVDKQLWQELEKIANANGCAEILFCTWENTSCYKYAVDLGVEDYVTSDPNTSSHCIAYIPSKPN